ncbi:MAG: putative metal-dependent hydrolase [Saprospiraceae bacterium]|nr:putative metal-dependent hydrolase [Saprospiraceae bacterium]
MTIEQLKYPIGHFELPDDITMEILSNWIKDISTFPFRLNQEVKDLSSDQLDTPYRPDGWTIRQVVHHCADSHMNSFIRLKLSLTEENPTIKPYHEDRWANLPDCIDYLVESSVKIIEGIHERWIVLLNNMSPQDFNRSYFHPGSNKKFSLLEMTGLYAWHCNHHLAHITNLKERMGWNL